jgi:hypothetical protein
MTTRSLVDPVTHEKYKFHLIKQFSYQTGLEPTMAGQGLVLLSNCSSSPISLSTSVSPEVVFQGGTGYIR